MKNFLKKYRFAILRTIIVMVILAAIAVGVYFILKACGFTTKEDFLSLRDKIGSNIWFWIIIGALQIVQVIFIPLTNQIITVPCALVFSDELWKVWLTSWISIWIATIILYWIGRSGGRALIRWILNDEEQVERCTNYLRRGWVFYPICMLLPLPDDVVTTLAGTAKMKFLFVLVCSFFTRGIDTACSVYGWGYLTRFWWGWVLLIIGCILLFVLTFFLWKIDQKRIKSSQDQEIEEQQ
jgi:uncharacterized membrane protein YdjX (TVP38/TMEM64 family)